MNIKRLLNFEWDAIAGIVAAVVAIVLHLLHVVDEQVILPIVLALMALLFINFMRHARSNELTAEQVDHATRMLRRIQSQLKPSEVLLVGPRHLRSANEQFVRHMSGDTVWFNLCLSMYRPQPLFDALLRPAIENPMVSSIQFILDESQQTTFNAAIPGIVAQQAALVAQAHAEEAEARKPKPPEVLGRIVDGRMSKWLDESVLMRQPYIRDETHTQAFGQIVTAAIAKIGENIVVRRFARFELGDRETE